MNIPETLISFKLWHTKYKYKLRESCRLHGCHNRCYAAAHDSGSPAHSKWTPCVAFAYNHSMLHWSKPLKPKIQWLPTSMNLIIICSRVCSKKPYDPLKYTMHQKHACDREMEAETLRVLWDQWLKTSLIWIYTYICHASKHACKGI